MSEFIHGQKISELYLPDEGFYFVDKNGVKDITVVMENGQMARVHWFLVTFNDGRQSRKFNGALVEGVALLEAEANE